MIESEFAQGGMLTLGFLLLLYVGKKLLDLRITSYWNYFKDLVHWQEIKEYIDERIEAVIKDKLLNDELASKKDVDGVRLSLMKELTDNFLNKEEIQKLVEKEVGECRSIAKELYVDTKQMNVAMESLRSSITQYIDSHTEAMRTGHANLHTDMNGNVKELYGKVEEVAKSVSQLNIAVIEALTAQAKKES